MNAGTRINAESKKKKKTTTTSVKNNQSNMASNSYSHYLPKNEPEKFNTTQKIYRPIKNDTTSKPLRPNQSVKEINKPIIKNVIHAEPNTSRPQTSKNCTKENQDILDRIGYPTKENDSINVNKRWTDIPRTHDTSNIGPNTTSYISSRTRLDNVVEEQKNQKGHQRTNSFSRLNHAQYQPSIQIQTQPVEVIRQQFVNKTLQNKNISKVTKGNSNSSSGLNNTNNSFVSQEGILEELPLTEVKPTYSKISIETSIKLKPSQKSPDYFETENSNSTKHNHLKSSDRMNIEESLKIQHLKSNSKDKPRDAIKIIEEPVAQFPIEPRSTNVVNYSSLPPSSTASNINASGCTPNYSSNPVNSGNSSNAQNSNQKNSLPENFNKKSSTGKSSNPISNNSSYMKSKGRKSSNTHKTESTCSGENSPSPVLDCEEMLNNNFDAVSNKKVENNSFWVDKFDPEPKSSDSLENEDKRGILRDITDAIMKADSIQEELANFNPDNSSCAIDSDTITYLVSREIDYSPDSHYFDKKQNQVTWIMRGILFDWMMEVCMEFTLKRETFHYSINYVDRYLSSVPNIQKWELQLVGVTAMYIASKVEEIYAPKVSDFAKSADNGYTTQQIMDMEMKMLKGLKWLLNPPTLNTWANWYLTQWDLYIDNSPYAKNHQLILTSDEGLINFKQPNEKSYARFREIMQIIDCAILDIQTLQYKPRTLIAAFMYLTIGKHYKQFTVEQIYEEFPNSSLYLLDQEYAFNDLFADFLLYSFGFQLVDLLPSIQYASTFFKLPLNFDLPTAAKINKENVLEGHFEEFLAYQTHHPMNVDYIRKRPRNVF